MTSQAAIDEHTATIRQIVTLAERAAIGAFRSSVTPDAAASTAALKRTIPAVVETFGEIAAATGANFYDDARTASAPTGRFRARPTRSAPITQVEATIGWAVTPLWSDEPRPSAALSRLVSGVGRLVQLPERSTIWEASQDDPAAPRYARVPFGPDPCPWCLMLASRGGVYRSEDSASGYHDDCYCRPVPVWRASDLPLANRQLADLWDTSGVSTFEEWREYLAAAPLTRSTIAA